MENISITYTLPGGRVAQADLEEMGVYTHKEFHLDVYMDNAELTELAWTEEPVLSFEFEGELKKMTKVKLLK